jgi:hypothetical protein
MISNLSFYVSTIIYYLSKDFLLDVVIYLLFNYLFIANALGWNM